jgi:CheY-like chemotaxis protein
VTTERWPAWRMLAGGVSLAHRREILLVTDLFTVVVLREALQDEGFVVREAMSLTAVVNVLRRHPDIALALVDVNLHVADDGLSIAGCIRHERPDIALLVTSGSRFTPPADMQDHVTILTKPFRITDFVQTVGALLNDRKQN